MPGRPAVGHVDELSVYQRGTESLRSLWQYHAFIYRFNDVIFLLCGRDGGAELSIGSFTSILQAFLNVCRTLFLCTISFVTSSGPVQVQNCPHCSIHAAIVPKCPAAKPRP